MEEHQYCCIDCKKQLIINGDVAACPDCKKSWNKKDGIFDFSTIEHYWNQISADEMNLIIGVAEDKGWKKAIIDFFGNDQKYLQDYIIKSSRADWTLFAPIKSSSTVLDVGSGWGAVTIELAKKYKKVYATDCNYDTLNFLNIRAKQEGIENIVTIKINPLDYPKLPFKDSFFDMIVLDGILEWVGGTRNDKSPYEIQLEALKSLSSILKPNGYIFLGIENRYAFKNFLAGTPHGEVPFASVLPRKIANFFTKLIRNEEHRTYIYSKNEYIKLFNKAGYSVNNIYAMKPSYRFPKRIIPIEKISNYYLKNFYTKNDSLLIRGAKNVLHLLPGHLLVSGFGIFAKKK